MIEQTEFYSIRLLINHPSWSVAEITAKIGEEPDYSWDVGEKGKTITMWGLNSFTTGQRLFFKEVKSILSWLQSKGPLTKELKESGGSFELIVQLPGTVNLGDTLELEVMQLASTLGVELGIEVFPNMRLPDPKVE